MQQLTWRSTKHRYEQFSFRSFKVAGYLLGSLFHTMITRTEIAKDLLWLLSSPLSILPIYTTFPCGWSHIGYEAVQHTWPFAQDVIK